MFQMCNINISHDFEVDILEYQPRSDTKALARNVNRCRTRPCRRVADILV